MNNETRITTLDNGVQIATTAMPHMASASVGFWSRVGSRHEPAGLNGIVHFIEHLLFKGTPTRSAEDISRQIERLGASLDGFTVEDHTCFSAKGPAEQLEPMLDVLADFYQNPVFDPAEIESERNVIREEIAMVHDLPAQMLEDLLSESAWGPEHPLGRPITGTEISLMGITRSDILDFFHRSFAGNQSVVAVAGNIDHDQTVDWIGERLSNLSSVKEFEFERAGGPRQGFIFEARPEIEHTYLAIGYRGYDRMHPERYAQKMLNVLLGENMSSRLFQILREQAGLCYEVQSDIMSFQDAGMLHLYLSLDPENIDEALTAITLILKAFREYAPSIEEIEEAKAYMIGQSRIALENTASQMMWGGECLLGFNEWIDPEVVFQRIKAVTPDQVRDCANDLFQSQNLCIAGIGPEAAESVLMNWQSVSE